MEYLQADVCGIDNCRATQYQLEDGRWFCRNGHQKEVGLLLDRDYDPELGLI